MVILALLEDGSSLEERRLLSFLRGEDVSAAKGAAANLLIRGEGF